MTHDLVGSESALGESARLSRWSMRNFKAAARVDVPLAPLTVLVGANSAGKSSLIQSILLFRQAQTDPHQPSDLIALNGAWTHLGSFDEVLSVHCDPRRDQIELGGTVEVQPGGRKYSWRSSFGAPRREWLGSLQVTSTSIAASGNGPRVVGRLDRRSRPAQYAAPMPVFMAGDWHGDRSQRLAETALAAFQGEVQVGRGRKSMVKAAAGAPLAGLPELFLVRERLSGVAGRRDLYSLPELLAGGRNDHMETVRLVTQVLRTGSARLPEGAEGLTALVERTADAVAGSVRAYLGDRGRVSAAGGPDLGPRALALVNDIHRDLFDIAVQVASGRTSHAAAVGELGRAIRGQGAGVNIAVLAEMEEAQAVRRASDGLREMLGERVRYLGPLRAAPRGLHRDYVEADGVGPAGEFTASLLEAHASRRITYCRAGTATMVEDPLGVAVTYWLSAMGLADDVTTQSLGRYGAELRVRPVAVPRRLDLGNVGVGISQVLPVVVLGLVSPPGSIILLEQPELHLHPLGQQSLGDFLLALMHGGRQVVVETHSDHLVSRLRRRAAEDAASAVADQVGFLFAERSTRTGRTRYRAIQPNAFGGLDDWPEGFMDQGVREAALIIGAALDKRSSRKR